MLVRVVIRVHRQNELLHLIGALSTAGRLTSSLHGWQEQSDKDADDRNDDQQLNKCKSVQGPREAVTLPVSDLFPLAPYTEN